MLKLLLLTTTLLLPQTLQAREIIPPQFSDMKGKRLSTIEVLAVNAYHEARGESDLANLMIMATVFNRVYSWRYPNSVEGVVFKKGAYSWTNDNKSDKVRDSKSYRRLYLLAEEFIINKRFYLDLSKGVNHYHTTTSSPYWKDAEEMEYVMTIDNHKFYKYK